MLAYLDTILRHPAIIAVISLLLGTWLFGHISYLRSRRDLRRTKSIEFLEEVSKAVNSPLFALFGHIRTRATSIDKSLDDDIGNLFKLRLSVRVKSQAYLESDQFWKSYDEIVWEMARTRDALRQVAVRKDADAFARELRNHNIQLATKWKVSEDNEDLEQPYDAIICLPNMIWDRTHSLLSEHLTKALTSKR